MTHLSMEEIETLVFEMPPDSIADTPRLHVDECDACAERLLGVKSFFTELTLLGLEQCEIQDSLLPEKEEEAVDFPRARPESSR